MPKKTTSSHSRRAQPGAAGIPIRERAAAVPAAPPVNAAGLRAEEGPSKTRSGDSRGPAPRAPDRDGPRGGSRRVGPGSVTEWDLLTRASQDEIEQLVEVLKAVKGGDFSVRLPYRRDGVLARAGELLNDIIALNEHVSSELLRVAKIVGREGRMTERASVGPAKRRVGSRDERGEPAHRRPRRADERGRARHHGGRQGRPLAEDVARHRGPPGARRVPPHRHDRELDGRSAQLVRGGGDARREGGRQRGEAGRPGRGEGRQRHLEGPDRQRERPRREPHRAGAQHRQGHDRRREGRPLAEDHRRREAARSSS